MIQVLGTLDSGLIITASRPSHLPGPPQSLILTPDTARELLQQLRRLEAEEAERWRDAAIKHGGTPA